ncbi:uncharacterized protein LOC115997321 [Ipomoea triloba]|uniref:uncharacterized protein LOC115997321 n=1 Tax=Ipomoea triloba TaxID=35885 RepID=UPI00125E9DA8|nr:uncharacterized protein LOC115997321 [Ipomoea triloba]GLL46065.1 uncharacterized protein LOC109150167 [Ipomoea trifida]GMD86688.1 uncharacterized protein LOC109150167 [Ipomoea batatas]GMD95423.1 uncharacterized protein LOC109150167 [Ipomoea batatas]GME19619.1 uncharacterized protein LOC109150167 [Ipomoea batatas]
MTKRVSLRSALSAREPLLNPGRDSSSGPEGVRRARFAEVAGGTTADIAAVCCCCPCGLVNLVVLAVYKLPAGICRKAIRSKRRRRLMKSGDWPVRHCSCADSELQIHTITSPSAVAAALESDKEVVELEKEMWDRFYGAGFWRSPSQRSEVSQISGI